MARQLIESLSADFDPEKYRDEYRDRVLDLIERKAQGEEIVIEAAPEQPKEVPDLMAALEASIAAAKSPGGRKETAAKADEGMPPRTARRALRRRPARRRAAARVRAARPPPRSSPVRCRPPAGWRSEVEGRRLSLSNLDKVIYPEVGFTKGQVIDYYTRIAPVLLPHLRGHPLTLKRYPNGVEGQYFYEKQCPSHRPEWVRSAAIPVSRKTIDFCLCDDLPTLVWLANLADLELHPSLSLAEAIEQPTVMAFDLDPGPPAGIAECCEVAVLLRETLTSLGLESFPKTSGSKGMQVYVPLNAARPATTTRSRCLRRWRATSRRSIRS